MAVEIETLVLKGRFGAQRNETTDLRQQLEDALEMLRADILRDVDDRLDAAERRARER